MSHPDRYHAQEAIDRLPPVALSAHAGDVRSAVDASWTPERPREQVHETDEPRDGTRRLRIFLRGCYVTRAHQPRRPEFQAAEWMVRWSARTATVELAGMVDMEREAAVLDIGCGIGGTARHLAAEYGCHVTGIDLTPDYCTLACDLSARVGLEGRTSFRQGSALDLPWKDESFDIVWTEHVQMNISDKERFYREAARVLRKGGRFAFHDIFAGANDGLSFPVPWAAAPDMSFLAPADDVRDLLKNLDLTEVSWEDSTARSTAWFEAARERNAKLGPPALGLHLVMGPTAQQKFGNVLSGLKYGQLTTVLAVFEK
jgi:SAM-dependent methyltransferase